MQSISVTPVAKGSGSKKSNISSEQPLSVSRQRKLARAALPDGLDLRMAELSDIPQLVDLARRFFAESQYPNLGIVFSRLAYERYLIHVLTNNISPHIIALVNGELVGVISWVQDFSYSDDPIATMTMFYVSPDHRKSALGRLLCETAEETAVRTGCCAIFMPVNSGTGSTISMCNMFSRRGFISSGVIMSKGFI
jgi:GNAT superfamily N-acetyltransferase